MGLTFLNPALIGGFFAIAVPLIIHLLNRRSPRNHLFPTVDFLRVSVAHKSRIHRLRQWLILLIRTLLVASVVAAFCRPSLDLRAAAGIDKDAPGAIVLIMDVSASMGGTDTKGTPLLRAQSEAGDLIRSLRAEDAANVIFCAADSQAVFPEPGTNHAGLIESVAGATARPETARMTNAIAAALDQVSRSPAPRKEIHIISDYQRTNWAEVDLRSVPPDVFVSFVDAGQPRRPNQAIVELRSEPAYPSANAPFEVLVSVANYSDALAEVPVRLAGPAGDLGERSLSLTPWSSGTASFLLNAGQAGDFNLDARIPTDAFALDDVRYASIRVRDQIQVLLVTDEAGAAGNPAESSSYYVLSALLPKGGEGSAYAVTAVRAHDLPAALKVEPQVMIVTNVGLLNESALGAIVKYVQSGGGLLWFLWPGPMDSNQYALDRTAGGGGFFPMRVGALETAPSESGGVRFGELDTRQPPLRLFKSPENGDLTEARFHSWFRATDAAPIARVLARYENGNIALASAAFGEGRILAANFAPSRRGTDWPTRPTFLPFLHECLLHLRGGNPAPDIHPGETLAMTLEGVHESLTLAGPSKKSAPMTTNVLGKNTEISCGGIAETGIHTILSGTNRIRSIAVNVDPAESDLRALSTREISLESHPAALMESVETGRGQESLDAVRRGRPIWQMLIAAALALAVLEQALTALWKAG